MIAITEAALTDGGVVARREDYYSMRFDWVLESSRYLGRSTSIPRLL
jgi:hypothetical protein